MSGPLPKSTLTTHSLSEWTIVAAAYVLGAVRLSVVVYSHCDLPRRTQGITTWEARRSGSQSGSPIVTRNRSCLNFLLSQSNVTRPFIPLSLGRGGKTTEAVIYQLWLPKVLYSGSSTWP